MTLRTHASRLVLMATAAAAMATATSSYADVVPAVTKPALFDVVHRAFAANEPVKPGETAAALLRAAQVGCPDNEALARLDASRLRYALLGGEWLTRRTSEKSVLSDAAQWQVRTFMANVENEVGGLVEGLNLRVDGLRCSVGASEVAWLVDQLAGLDAAHLKRGKARLAQYGIAELPVQPKSLAVKSAAVAIKQDSAKARFQGYFPDYLKAKDGGPGKFVFSAESLERSLALRANGTMLDSEVAGVFCGQWGQTLKSMERISRGAGAGDLVEYGAVYTCDGSAGADEAVAELANSYLRYQASIEAGTTARGKFAATLRFGTLSRAQAHTLVRWAVQTGMAQAASNCGSSQYPVLKVLDFWLATTETSRDAVVTLETQCNRRSR